VSESNQAGSYDPFSAETMADPGPSHAALVENEPVHYFPNFDPPFYTLSKNQDVGEALRDIELFSSEHGQGPRFSQPMGMLSNPPQHTFFRNLVQQAFTPKVIATLAVRVRELSQELLDAVADKDNFELHDDYAAPLPVIIVSEVLGVPAADRLQFKSWSDAQVAAMGAADPSVYEAPMMELAAYLMEHITRRRSKVDAGQEIEDDLIARLVKVREQGKGLDDKQVLSVVSQLLVGGNETTTSLITNAVWRLLQVPGRWQTLVEHPELVERAVEESLRYDPPVLGLYRTVTRDVEIRGVTIPANSKVMLNYAAANRDPEVFDEPNEFRLDRPTQRHFSFGLGVHFCLGAQLARLEATTALSTLLQRFPKLGLLNDGERIAPFFLWGRQRLPVVSHRQSGK
jgi:cytochrome P450